MPISHLFVLYNTHVLLQKCRVAGRGVTCAPLADQARPGQATAARSARSRWPLRRAVHASHLSRRVGVACASRRRAARPRSPVPRRRTNRIPRPVVSRPTMATRSYVVRTPARWRIAPCRRSRLEGGAATDPSWPWPLGGSSWGLLVAIATVLAQATVHAGRDHPPRPRRRITVVWYGAHIPAPLRRHPRRWLLSVLVQTRPRVK